MDGVVTKSEFAALMGVSRQRVSQWLGARQIDGVALIGEGRGARIDVEAARRQLDGRLDLGSGLGPTARRGLTAWFRRIRRTQRSSRPGFAS